MKALRYHFLLASMAGGILFVLFNLMPNEARFDVATTFESASLSPANDTTLVITPIGVGQGFGVKTGF